MALESLLVIMKQWCKGGSVSLKFWFFSGGRKLIPHYFYLWKQNWIQASVSEDKEKKIAVASCGLQVANTNMYLTYFTWAGKKSGSVILDRQNKQLRFRRKTSAFRTAFALFRRCSSYRSVRHWCTDLRASWQGLPTRGGHTLFGKGLLRPRGRNREDCCEHIVFIPRGGRLRISPRWICILVMEIEDQLFVILSPAHCTKTLCAAVFPPYFFAAQLHFLSYSNICNLPLQEECEFDAAFTEGQHPHAFSPW